MTDEEITEKTHKLIAEIWSRAGIFFNQDHIKLLVHVTNTVYDRGHRYSYDEVADFVAHPNNRETIKEYGLTKVIQAVTKMKMPPIKGGQLPPRNSKCYCGSEKKFKNCCNQTKLFNGIRKFSRPETQGSGQNMESGKGVQTVPTQQGD